MTTRPADVALAFVDAINRRSVASIAALLADDTRFVDSLGAAVHGREAVSRAWEAYFAMVPDYRVTVARVVADGESVVMLGAAGGTYAPAGAAVPGGAWSTPAAWRAEVAGERVALWQVFADNEPLRASMRQYQDHPEPP